MDAVITSLLGERQSFLDFLVRRLGDRAAAEDILQDAFARGVLHRDSLRADESARAWFYRILRNAVIDHRRRNATMGRALDALASDIDEEPAAPPPSLQSVVCPCVRRIADEIKPEYASALQRVTLEGQSVKDFAAAEGITANNAAVRVFRAREALRVKVQAGCGACADAGCTDCTCVVA
ncbi:MAG: RNA polymerase sigma factor [Deltaproteobacteria bacterium]|nr:RNA polymerase sigma factor [Deltaproteobacteria bacterium]